MWNWYEIVIFVGLPIGLGALMGFWPTKRRRRIAALNRKSDKLNRATRLTD